MLRRLNQVSSSTKSNVITTNTVFIGLFLIELAAVKVVAGCWLLAAKQICIWLSASMLSTTNLQQVQHMTFR
jgi:hypothetical protein